MKAFSKTMSRRSQAHDWCSDWLPYFAGWCGFLTLLVTIFFAVGGQKSTGGLIGFYVGSSFLTLIWFIVSAILIAGKRRQVQKDRNIENLQFINRRREQMTANQKIAEISESAKNADQAINSIASSGLKFTEDQFKALKDLGQDLISISQRNENRDAIRDQEKKELCEKIEKFGDRVDNMTFEILKSKVQNDPDSISVFSEGSKSI